MTAPGWAQAILDSHHIIAVVAAIATPLLRGLIRWMRGCETIFDVNTSFHDVAAGFLFPSFLLMILSGVLPDGMKAINEHALQLVGALGILHIIRELCSVPHEEKSMFRSGNTRF